MQQTTFTQQETVSYPSLPSVLSSYKFLDGHTEMYDMEVYNLIAMSTDLQGHVLQALSSDVIHSVAMHVYIDSFVAETGHVPAELITLIGSNIQ